MRILLLRSRLLQRASGFVFLRSYTSRIQTKHIMQEDARQTMGLLKFARDDPVKLDSLLRLRAARLVKEDIVRVCYTLFDEDEAELAMKVFRLIQKEPWYTPTSISHDLVARALARNAKFDELETVMPLIEREGGGLPSKLAMDLVDYCMEGKSYELGTRILKKTRKWTKEGYYEPVIRTLNAAGQFSLSLRLEEEIEAAKEGETMRPRVDEIHSARPWAS